MVDSRRRRQIAAAVRQARLSAGLSQEELAQRVGVHKRTIGNVESGSRDTTHETLRGIERALGIDLSPGALTASAALHIVSETIRETHAGLSESLALMFIGDVLTFVSHWSPGSRHGTPPPQMRAQQRPDQPQRPTNQPQRKDKPHG